METSVAKVLAHRIAKGIAVLLEHIDGSPKSINSKRRGNSASFDLRLALLMEDFCIVSTVGFSLMVRCPSLNKASTCSIGGLKPAANAVFVFRKGSVFCQ